MNKFITILFFVSFSLHSQSIDFIKNQDTIYIKYSGNLKNEKKRETLNKDNIKFKFYRLIKHSILFSYPIVGERDTITSRILIDNKLVDKTFLRKVKNKTISYKFFEKFKTCNKCEIFILSLKQKVIYIIDYTEEKDNKIPIYQIRAMKNCPYIM